jgi:hypothetical protein
VRTKAGAQQWIAFAALALWLAGCSGGSSPPNYVAKVVSTVKIAPRIPGGWEAVGVDVENNGGTEGTLPTCAVTFLAADGSTLATRPFFPGQVLAGETKLVTLKAKGVEISLVKDVTAACQ